MADTTASANNNEKLVSVSRVDESESDVAPEQSGSESEGGSDSSPVDTDETKTDPDSDTTLH